MTAMPAPSAPVESFVARELCRACCVHRPAQVEVSRTGVRMTFPDCGHRRYDAVFHSPYTRHHTPRSTR